MWLLMILKWNAAMSVVTVKVVVVAAFCSLKNILIEKMEGSWL